MITNTMNHYLPLALGICVLVAGCSKTNPGEIDSDNASITSTQYRLTGFQWITDSGSESTIYEYNEHGNLVKRTIIDADGTKQVQNNTFDQNGVISGRTEDTDGDGVDDTSSTFEYNRNSEVVGIVNSDSASGAVVSMGSFAMDENDNPLYQDRTSYNTDGSLRDMFRVDYLFSENRLLQASIDTDGDSEADLTTQYEYDSQGLLLKTIDIGSSQRVTTASYEQGLCNPGFFNKRFHYFCVMVSN